MNFDKGAPLVRSQLLPVLEAKSGAVTDDQVTNSLQFHDRLENQLGEHLSDAFHRVIEDLELGERRL